MSIWPFTKASSVASLYRPPLPELRHRTRILVVDDEPDSFPVSLLRKEGYAIDQWNTIQNMSDLTDGKFDILFLDIHGVAEHLSANDGLGIIEHVKGLEPSQIVVAFSGNSYSLSNHRFFAMADDTLSKPIDVAKCKAMIDRLIEAKHRPEYYWGKIAECLRETGSSERQVRKLEGQFTKALIKKDDKIALDLFKTVASDPEVLRTLTAIGGKIALLCI